MIPDFWIFVPSILTSVVVATLLVRDHSFSGRWADSALQEANLDRDAVAMLTGGANRIVDATVVDLVEQGQVLVRSDKELADTGRFSLNPELPAETYQLPKDTDYLWSLSWQIYETHGYDRWGIKRLRNECYDSPIHASLLRLMKLRLAVSPRRRALNPSAIAAPQTLAAFVVMPFASPENFVAAFSPVLICILHYFLLLARPGYHGQDPRTGLGRACAQALATTVSPGDTQAQRVARGGFSAMTDEALFQKLGRPTDDQVWKLPEWYRRNVESYNKMFRRISYSMNRNW